MMLNRFDNQAEQFDRRAGLPDVVCQAVAQAVVEMAATPREGLLLEVGAGTGQIGQHLQKSPFRYVGFDVSSPMLQVFRERLLQLGAEVELIEADGNRRWPVPDASTVITFSSRTLHLLDTKHVVQEIFRVTAVHGGALITGRVHRDPDCVKAEMRRQMRQFLQELGIQGRGGEQIRQALFDRCCACGGVFLEPVTAATWESEHTPLRSIESWESKQGLAGISVSAEVKQTVLERLRRWAVQRYDDLRRPCVMREMYLLEGVKIPPHRET